MPFTHFTLLILMKKVDCLNELISTDFFSMEYFFLFFFIVERELAGRDSLRKS